MTTEKPLHIAIIPDGNRRWAAKHSLQPWKGHEQAVDNFRTLLQWCKEDTRINVLTIWCFSTENWGRTPKEIDALFRILATYLENERITFQQEHIRLLHSGRTDRIPKNVLSLLQEIGNETRENDEMTLHLAIDYGGKDEVTRAVQKACMRNETVDTPEDIKQYLDQPTLQDIDLIIRTSGEMRTSNFFLWQSAYAEWMFTPTLFPDFTVQELSKHIEDFTQRKRRFGS